ncbi:class I SAM-dependent methyltransferase [Paenibacillus tarimensis]
MKSYEQIGVAMTCRGYEEYKRMFAIDEEVLRAGEILDVAGGASSFTAEAAEKGYAGAAVDPRYALDPVTIEEEARAEIEASTAKLAGLKEQFDWTYYGDPARHRLGRIASLERFAADLGRPDSHLRYYAGALPELPFDNDRFSLVLCSHFLFLYGNQFDPAFHTRALLELMRVCRPGGQIRIYPLITLEFKPYPFLEQLLATIREAGGLPELGSAGLPFIPGSTRYLNISV